MAKIRVRFGNAEAEVESDPDDIIEMIALVPELASKLPRGGSEAPARPDTTLAESRGGLPSSGGGDLPNVVLDKGDSLADVIGKFFADPWGRERRKLSDVREALQSYGMNYPKQSVAVALLRLAKTTKLRRFKGDDGEFVYTATSVSQVPLRSPTEEEAIAPRPT